MFGCNEVATPLVVYDKLKKEDGDKKVDKTYYRSFIENLFYLTATRPDIMTASSLLSRFMHSPNKFILW